MGYTYLSLLDSPGLFSNFSDFNCSSKALTAKLLGSAIVILNFIKPFRTFIADTEKYRVSLNTLLQQGISEPEFYGDLMYRFRKIVGKI